MLNIVFQGKKEQVTEFKKLDNDLSENIGAWYRGVELLSEASSSLLSEVRNMKGMLACYCQIPTPLMHVRKTKHSYSLVINKKSMEHQSSCVFHNDYRRKNQAGIIQLISQSLQCNRVKSNWKTNSNDLLEQYKAIRKDIKKIQVAPGIEINQYFDTMPNSVNKLAGRMRKYKGVWPEEGEFASVLAVVTDSIIGHEINYTHKQQTGSFKISGQNVLAKNVDGPYFSLVKLAENNKGYIQPMEAYSIPIMSRRTLVKIQKSSHRLLLRKLMQLQQWWSEKHNLEIEIKAVYQNAVDYELYKDKSIVARTSCIESFKDKLDIRNNGMDVIYYDLENLDNEKEKHYAKILTARILTQQDYKNAS